ncbi:hypothetical protein C4D60_Mb11t19080 [Musa balbisiana]|uniref:Nascent polypeptide-associated complex subunit alpha-like UBA domain-containing protein n=1 Tax=Musa balbisiana TaxID=52838 RepID=A0A4S8J7N9_MUSBA|nr:hypothetical protein C4D60_Mb11t19080 [Musa balbisiana]
MGGTIVNFGTLTPLHPNGDHKAGADNSSKQSRSEKKSRKAMMKLGMKPVTGASRITIKRTKTNSRPQQHGGQGVPTGEDEEEIDESGLEPRDIDLVMTQAGVSRAKAGKALKTNNGAHLLAMQIN